MRAAVSLLLVLGVAACSSGQVAHGYRDMSGQQRTTADLDRSMAECDFEQDKMAALVGPLAAGPRLYQSCMSSKGWQLVERSIVK